MVEMHKHRHIYMRWIYNNNQMSWESHWIWGPQTSMCYYLSMVYAKIIDVLFNGHEVMHSEHFKYFITWFKKIYSRIE